MEGDTIGGRENMSQKEGGRERGKEGKERESRVQKRHREIKLEMRDDNKREKGKREIQ